MIVTSIAPTRAPLGATIAAEALPAPGGGVTMAQIRTELASPVAFVTSAHHGWGEPAPKPKPGHKPGA